MKAPRRGCVSSSLRALGIASAIALVGCGASPAVIRGYDGSVVSGRYVPGPAYAAFLRGSIAEAGGKWAEALGAYTEASRIDPASPEIWTRIATVLDAASPSDPRVADALAKALAQDPSFAPALTLKASLALAQGDFASAGALARRAAHLDPIADRANIIAFRAARAPRRQSTREALVALTITAREPALPLRAAAAWGYANGDLALLGLAYEGLARIAPEERSLAAREAEQMAIAGETGEARAIAAAAVSASVAPLPPQFALAARLAVDEAIAQNDAGLVRVRATQAHVPIEEAAARAILSDNLPLAQDIARGAALADYGGVRLVLSAGKSDVLGVLAEMKRVKAPISAATWVVVEGEVTRALSSAARDALPAMTHEPIVPGDALVIRASRPFEKTNTPKPAR